MKHESFNESTEMYLKTVSELAGDARPVSIAAIAERLGISPVSATEMVHRLQARGYLEHMPYKGVSLTVKGRRRANLLIRTHHLWERLLVDKLNIPWEKAHEYACRLEHATDTAVTESLATFLNHPATCPHGNPIPTADGHIAATNDIPLADLAVGQSGVITRIAPESALLFEYLAARQLQPGTAVTVTEIAPFNGPFIVVSGQTMHPLGPEVAAHIFVQISAEGEGNELS